MGTLFRRYWRQILVTLVLLVSWLAFIQSGMAGWDFPGTLFRALYYALSLFLLGGLDIGLPDAANTIWLIILWTCYFLAPLLTVSFVYEVIQEKFFDRLTPCLKNHTIICGLGRTGQLVYDLAKEHYPKKHKIVVIEVKQQSTNAAFVEKDPKTWWINDDFTRLPVLQKAKLRKASNLIITTNHDFANLKAVFLLSRWIENTDCRVFCHLGDTHLHKNFSEILFRDDFIRHIEFFNAYHYATGRLYHEWVWKTHDPKQGKSMIIVGLGHFGKMLLSHILSDSSLTAKDELFVVSLKTSFDIDIYQYEWGKNTELKLKIHEPIRDDINDPAVWDKLHEKLEKSQNQTFVFLCRDDDIANVQVALSMKCEGPPCLRESVFYCRIYSETVKEMNEALEKRVTAGQSRDIVLFPLHQELKKALQEKIFKA